MWMQIVAEDLLGNGLTTSYSQTPNECPICHVRIEGRRLQGNAALCHIESVVEQEQVENSEEQSAETQPHPRKEVIQVAFRCTNRECACFFIANYERRTTSQPTPDVPSGQYLFLIGVAPIHPVKAEFSAEIQQVSPMFIEIYNEASAAEAANLSHIAGMGLRKSLEFLIKDFAIKQKPDKEEEIKNTKTLGNTIKQWVDDPRVKQTAELATWLGNDETHYIRTWKDKNIHDLKLLIKLTVNWIESVELTEKYRNEMKP